jgi:hypothetical protein
VADYDAMRLGLIYSIIGQTVTVTLNDSDETEITLRVIDKTRGVVVQLGDVDARSISPAAAVRMTELTTLGLTLAALDDARIGLAGTVWRIRGHKLEPGIFGEFKGEAYLLLTDRELDFDATGTE